LASPSVGGPGAGSGRASLSVDRPCYGRRQLRLYVAGGHAAQRHRLRIGQNYHSQHGASRNRAEFDLHRADHVVDAVRDQTLVGDLRSSGQPGGASASTTVDRGVESRAVVPTAAESCWDNRSTIKAATLKSNLVGALASKLTHLWGCWLEFEICPRKH